MSDPYDPGCVAGLVTLQKSGDRPAGGVCTPAFWVPATKRRPKYGCSNALARTQSGCQYRRSATRERMGTLSRILLISNLASGIETTPLTHADVLAMAGRATAALGQLLKSLVPEL